eukprot:12028097-Ditylum_brightwellii.AAC.1
MGLQHRNRLWELLMLEEKQWVGGLKAGIFCTISSGTNAQDTTLFPANVVGGADKTENVRPAFQVDHVDD